MVIRRGGTEVIPTSSEVAKARDERFNAELLNVGLSCGGVVISVLVAAAATGAAPVTGGTSLLLTHLSTAAAVAGGLQCLNAGYRMWNEVYDPQANIDLDNQEWYAMASSALDGISLAGAAISSAATIRMVVLLRGSTGKSTLAVLKGLTRQERKRLTEELVLAQNPNLSKHEARVMVSKGVFPKRYNNAEISQGIRKQLLDATGAAIGFTGSASGGIMSKALGVDLKLTREIRLF